MTSTGEHGKKAKSKKAATAAAPVPTRAVPSGRVASPKGEKAQDAPAKVRTLVRPVSNSIAILRYLGQRKDADTTSRIAKELSLNPSTCFNILRTLASEGVIDFDPVAKTYRLGHGLAKLAGSALSSGEPVALAKPGMHVLAQKYGVTMALWRIVGDSRIVLTAVENSSRELRIHMQEGLRIPSLLGATGRALALKIGKTKATLRQEFKLLRWARPLSFERFWDDATEAEKRGWATDDGHFSHGIRTVGAVVENAQGEPAFSLVALMFRDQHSDETIRQIGRDVAALAREMTRILY